MKAFEGFINALLLSSSSSFTLSLCTLSTVITQLRITHFSFFIFSTFYPSMISLVLIISNSFLYYVKGGNNQNLTFRVQIGKDIFKVLKVKLKLSFLKVKSFFYNFFSHFSNPKSTPIELYSLPIIEHLKQMCNIKFIQQYSNLFSILICSYIPLSTDDPSLESCGIPLIVWASWSGLFELLLYLH